MFLTSRTTQSHLMINRTVVTNNCCLTDYHAFAMVNKQSITNLRSGVYLNSRKEFGKLAYRFANENKKVLLAAGDTFRAAAADQLREAEDQVLRGDFAYVGVIGSRRKTAAVNQKLRERGVPEEAIARVHTPIGTPIKAVTPEEIAVSIAGELIYTRALRREATGFVPTGCPMH